MSESSRNLGKMQNFRFPIPAMDQRQVFREMIATEVRSGRMNQVRRARIVRFAAQLGLSAVETGRLIAECQEGTVPPQIAFEESRSDGKSQSALRTRLVSPQVAIVTGVLLLTIWLLRM